MDDMTCETGLILVRHGAVAARYRGLCYGRSDVQLGPEGYEQHRRQVELFKAVPLKRIVHSGLERTRLLAEALGAACAVEAVPCSLLQERDYGAWELRRWDWIYAEHGEEMMRMISDPQRYRPGGGETTFELRDRVVRWFSALPDAGLTVAVTHGGPMAALWGTLHNLAVDAWPALIPPYGGTTFVSATRLSPLRSIL
jgi:broad specificity phosphatase PhoE